MRESQMTAVLSDEAAKTLALFGFGVGFKTARRLARNSDVAPARLERERAQLSFSQKPGRGCTGADGRALGDP